MLVLDPRQATSAASPFQPLDGRPCPGKPGDGGAAGWGATASFCSLLTQCSQSIPCSQNPAAAVEAPPADAAAMPFLGLPVAEPAEDPALPLEAAVEGAPLAIGLADTPLPAAVAVAVAPADQTVPEAGAGEAADLTDAGDLETTAGWTLVAQTLGSSSWGANGPLAAARPVKAPIFAGYRPWSSTVAEDTTSGAATAPTTMPRAVAVAPAAPTDTATPLPTATPATATATATATDCAPLQATAATSEPATTTPAPLPTEAETVTPPPGPESAVAAAVVEASGEASSGADTQEDDARRGDQKHDAAMAPAVGAVTAEAVESVAGQVAASPAVAISVLLGAGAAKAGAAAATAQSGGDADAATAASIRAQLLAEVAAQGAGATGHERVVLQLEPEHLGKVQVQLQASGSRLEIVVQAQNPEAEKALADGAQELVEAILGRGEGRWQQVEVRFERSPHEREQRQPKDDTRGGGEQRRGNQQEQRRDQRADS